MSWFRRKLGQAGEDLACDYLRQQGYQILDRNYTCRLGEIDLICFHADSIVFVEVKTLTAAAAADPENKINLTKQRQIERVARVWIAAHRRPNCAYRFDAVSVIRPPTGEPIIRHIIEAFLPSC